jgi:hypothetical protein
MNVKFRKLLASRQSSEGQASKNPATRWMMDEGRWNEKVKLNKKRNGKTRFRRAARNDDDDFEFHILRANFKLMEEKNEKRGRRTD